jgi:hypothetical protein
MQVPIPETKMPRSKGNGTPPRLARLLPSPIEYEPATGVDSVSW